MRDPIIRKAAEVLGGMKEMSAMLGLKSRAAVYLWNRVPSHHVISLERLTGIHRGQLRPDLYPPETRGNGQARKLNGKSRGNGTAP